MDRLDILGLWLKARETMREMPEVVPLEIRWALVQADQEEALNWRYYLKTLKAAESEG